MGNPKISIIIPIYNVEEYIEDTLNSLLNQTIIKDMEILMIDDGSFDGSRYIIEKYSLDYENFYAYHKENEGPGIARNFGIDLAKGEYIHFLDSDDYVLPNTYERAYEIAKNNNSDFLSLFGVRMRRYNITDSYIYNNAFKNIIGTIDSAKLEDMPELIWDTFVTNKLYKKEFLEKNNLKFIKEKKYYEDVIFALGAYGLAEKISLTKDIFYYWRKRENSNFSITQQYSDINNFKDRINMINLCYEIAENANFNDDIKNELFFRWINYDLNIYLRIFYEYDEKYYQEIFEEINKILNIIPEEMLESLNSTKRIMYKMIKNNDYIGLKNFSKKYKELMKNPHIPDDLDDDYIKYIDFKKDAEYEKLIVKREEITFDDGNIYIKFHEKINYLNYNHPHETKAKLVDINNNEYSLEVYEKIDNEVTSEEKLKQIIIPIDLLFEKNHLKIKIEYITADFKKESYLINSKREIIEFDNFDVEIGIETNRLFFMNIRPTNNLNMQIHDIEFDNGIFKLYGVSNERIDNIFLENVISFEKIYYQVESEKENDDDFNINFTIPYVDILNAPVRKWEIKVDGTFKIIELNKRYEFYSQHTKIYFVNTRNKFLVSNDFYNIFDELYENNIEIYELTNDKKELKISNRTLIKENKKLTKKNKNLTNKNTNLTEKNKILKQNNDKLKKKNIKLEKKIEEYKSRLAVRLADKMKNI